MGTNAEWEPGMEPGQEATPRKRAHRATYARDKYDGGYNIRVVGPIANKFAGREVPVTRRDGTESKETLERLLWSGKDTDTGLPVALYSFEAKARDDQQQLEF